MCTMVKEHSSPLTRTPGMPQVSLQMLEAQLEGAQEGREGIHIHWTSLGPSSVLLSVSLLS